MLWLQAEARVLLVSNAFLAHETAWFLWTVDDSVEEVEKSFGVVQLQSKNNGFAVVLRSDVILELLVLLYALCRLLCSGECCCGSGVVPEG